MEIGINSAIEWTVRLVSLCVLVDTFEKLYKFREFKDSGFFGWERINQFSGFIERRAIIRKLAEIVFPFRVWIPLVALRGFGALFLLITAGRSGPVLTALIVLFAVGSLANFRRMPFGPEAPNRFTLTIIGALILQRLVPTESVTLACLWFIALQACLSYVTAGLSKLLNKEWRAGRGILNGFNATHYSASPVYARFLNRYRLTGKFLNHATLAVECSFPLVLVVGKPYFLFYLVWGVFLHISNAFVFRLNNYVWAWIATYPAIVYVAFK